MIDFTNKEAREWFVKRLNSLQWNHGIDSFSCDAGEITWLPKVYLQMILLNFSTDSFDELKGFDEYFLT